MQHMNTDNIVIKLYCVYLIFALVNLLFLAIFRLDSREKFSLYSYKRIVFYVIIIILIMSST